MSEPEISANGNTSLGVEEAEETFQDTYLPPEPLETLSAQTEDIPARIKHFQLRIRMLSEQLHILSANYQAGAGKIFSVLARELESLVHRLHEARSGDEEDGNVPLEEAFINLVDFLLKAQAGEIDLKTDENQAKLTDLQETLRMVLHETSQLLSQFNMVRIGIKMQAVRVGVSAFLDFGETLEKLYETQLRPWLESLKLLRLKLDRHVYRMQFIRMDV